MIRILINHLCKFQIKNPFSMLVVICLLLLGLANLEILAAENYQGTGILDIQSGSPRLQSFTFKSGDWFARSIDNLEKDIPTIQSLLEHQSPEKRIYLPDPSDREGLLSWVERFKLKQPCYQPFLVFKNAEESEVLALVELHTMPRAVIDPQKQEKILSFYQGKGLMTYNPCNAEEKLIGKYRPVKDGITSMARLRLLMSKEFLNKLPIMTDIIKGTSSLIRTFHDNGFPMHPYSTDLIQGLPSIVISYTALEDPVRQAYKDAGFNLEYNIAFKEFWPSEYHEKLPDNMVVVTQFINTISPSMMFSFEVAK